MKKICPRCNNTFICRVDNIELCNCKKVRLNAGVRDYIKKEYAGCLCLECLIEVNQKFETNKTSGNS